MESDKSQFKRKSNPCATANFLSRITFIWTLPIFLDGYKRDLTVDDLPVPLKEHSSTYLGNKLQKVWDEEVANAKLKKKEPSFLYAIIRVFGFHFLLLGVVLAFLELVLRIGQPLLLGGLIRYFSQPADGPRITINDAYWCAAGIIACSAFRIIMGHPYIMSVVHVGMKVRVATCSLIYRQALQLSKIALGQTTAGQVVNLLSNDVNRFDICFMFCHILWIGPIQTLIMLYLMWDMLGLAAVIGIASLLIFIPFQGWLGKKVSTFRLRTAIRTDERVRLMNEIINGIQVIKMYTWEKPFAALVDFARRKEIKEVSKSSQVKGVMLSFIVFHSRIAIFFTILSYVLLGHTINAEKVFVLTSFYSILRETMTVFFPQEITLMAEMLVTVKRVQDFLMISVKPTTFGELKANGQIELENTSLLIGNEDNYTKEMESLKKNDKVGITMKNATAKWSPNSHENTLSNITVDMNPGSLTAVIGPVGSGKTSLFHTILQELPLKSGSIEVHGRISYVSQEPWLFQGSARQNILFGQPYNRERYRKIVKVCSLVTDFEQFPYGDKTIVGERGVSLSGGQRARINLARAVYKEADIYLLDDPLSAVDTHVGKHLFEDCIEGYLRDKIVILITHQLQYLENVDQIMLMKNGTVECIGTYQTLRNTGLDFTQVMSRELHEEKEEEEQPSHPMQALGSRHASVQSMMASSFFDETMAKTPEEVTETQTTGTVGSKVYRAYLSAGGGCFRAIFVFFMCFLAQGIASSGDYFITYWVNLEEHYFTKIGPLDSYSSQSNFTTNNYNSSTNTSYNDTLSTTLPMPLNGTKYTIPEAPYQIVFSRNMCIYVFSAITGFMVIVTLLRSYLFFDMCMKSSIKLHNKMFVSISHATMWFFNNNTSGRILNRFSKDMGAIDELLPWTMIDVIQITMILLSVIIVVSLVNSLLLIPTLGCAVIFYFLRKIYLSTSQSVKRLEGITRSPVFAHLNASIQGLTTIRAFQAEKILIQEFDNHQDLHSSAWFFFITTSRAFGYWLDVVCLIYVAFVTLSFLVFSGEQFGGNVGLAISQAISLTGMFQWGMRQSAELVNQMTSVERVLEYSELESEPPLESAPENKPKPSWPENGKVNFNEVYLRYSDSEPWVLKDLNFTILPQEKIGIVGRTGAGKSSLISALFRLSEVNGAIVIDGVNTGSIGLHDLRSKISIIPQEPVLFSGTLRKNLDPFDDHNDDVLWDALDEVELRQVVKDLSGGLQAIISEGGSNLSVGQRQMVCLARAIVRNNKILVLDEATANVDPQTDAFIQQTIRKKFADCTVLTIAHRLNTVMDSDKILVMNAGSMVEFDHPHILLQNKNSFLSGMVEQTGKATEEVLRRVALLNYEKITNETSQTEKADQESSVI